jgi:exonuclease III
LDRLKPRVSTSFDRPAASDGRFHLFCRDSGLGLNELFSSDRLSLRRLRRGNESLLLGIVHVVDKWNWDESQQSTQVQLLSAEIHEHEKKHAHHRTILVGDFNMNPFDAAMNIAPLLNAMMTKKCVQAGSRRLQKREYSYFYNPMWSLLGDETFGPAGTYYHSVSSKGFFGWNMLDQVLVRPAALKWFKNVQILTSAGKTSLQTKSKRPDKVRASDHFPILLELN